MEITLQKQVYPDQDTKLSNIRTGYLAKHWWPEIDLTLNLQGIAADFYLFYAAKDGDAKLQQAFDQYSQVLAKQIAVYLDAAIGGELRHKGFAGLIKGFGDSRSIARRDWRVKRLAGGLDLLKGGRNNFRSGGWGGSFGGEKWAKIADMLVGHLDETYNNVLFIDQSLALQHNCGIVFNKLNGYWIQNALKSVLDANLNGDWSALLAYASPWATTIFTSWLGAEEELIVPGYETSKPRIVEITASGIGDFYTGSSVRIGPKVRRKDRRGLEGIITEVKSLYDVNKATKEKTLVPDRLYVQVLANGEHTWHNTPHLISLSTNENNSVVVSRNLEYY